MENKTMNINLRIERRPIINGLIVSDPLEFLRNLLDSDGDNGGDTDGDIPLLIRQDEDYDGFYEKEKKIFDL